MLTINDIIVVEQFRDKIPPISTEEKESLEKNILDDGEVRDSLVVWKGKNILIDGHNRLDILLKHPGIPYHITEMEFSDEWDATAWMCRNQLGRRNLTDEDRTYLIGKQSEAEKMTEKFHGNRYTGSSRSETDPLKPGKTMQRIADEYCVGYGTVDRAEKFAKGVDAAEKVSPGIKASILSGEVKAPKRIVAEMRNMDESEILEAVERIKRGEPIKQPQGKRYNGGGSKEYRELRESVEEIAADMYNTDKPTEYGVDDLIEEIHVNADAYIRQLKRTLEIRSTLLTGENRKAVKDSLELYVFQELRKVIDLVR